jgi:acyl carrier protein
MIIEKLITIIADHSGEDEANITAETTFEELGVDSLTTVEVLMGIEDEFGVTIEAAQVGKTVGDLAGPMFFAITMGTSRALYGKYGERLPLKRFIAGSGVLCLISYLVISLSPIPALGLIGCGICGFSVGIFWPGTFSLASASMPTGGTALFALLALGGDVGCSGGPTFVGLVSAAFGDDLRRGILCAIIFPILLLIGLALHAREKNRQESSAY